MPGEGRHVEADRRGVLHDQATEPGGVVFVPAARAAHVALEEAALVVVVVLVVVVLIEADAREPLRHASKLTRQRERSGLTTRHRREKKAATARSTK